MNGYNLVDSAFINITHISCFIYKMFSKLRDWLLPMLMNGQVTVKDMEPDNLSMAAAQELVYGKKKEEAF